MLLEWGQEMLSVVCMQRAVPNKMAGVARDKRERDILECLSTSALWDVNQIKGIQQAERTQLKL